MLIIFIIQQIDGNIIGPRILGDTTAFPHHGLSWRLSSLSGLFGVLGMFIGVPVFAVLYTLVKQSTETRLRRRGMPVSTDAYYPGEPEDTRPVKIHAPPTAYGGTAGADPDRLAPDDAIKTRKLKARRLMLPETQREARDLKIRQNDTAGVNESFLPQTQAHLVILPKTLQNHKLQSAPTDAGGK